MDDGDQPLVMAARQSPKGGHHHPLITRFQPILVLVIDSLVYIVNPLLAEESIIWT